MNRLQTLKRALLSVSGGIKNLLQSDFFSELNVKNCTYELVEGGFSVTPKVSTGGYGNSIEGVIITDVEWGKTYTISCHVKQTNANMKSAMRVCYKHSTSGVVKNLATVKDPLTDNTVNSITFTLPDTAPDGFEYIQYGYCKGVLLYFNVQTAALDTAETLTVTNIVLNEVK